MSAHEAGLAYIRDYYGVPAHMNSRINYGIPGNTRQGRIVGSSGPHLLVRLEGEAVDVPMHPTWRVAYPDGGSDA